MSNGVERKGGGGERGGWGLSFVGFEYFFSDITIREIQGVGLGVAELWRANKGKGIGLDGFQGGCCQSAGG
jgi:hypothetical protein